MARITLRLAHPLAQRFGGASQLGPTDCRTAHSDACASRCSSTIRTDRSAPHVLGARHTALRVQLCVVHWTRKSSMGPTHIDGGYLPVPWARTGPPAHPPPPTGSRCYQSKHAFSAGSALPAGKRESERFPKPSRRTFIQEGPTAASVRSGWACRNGSGLMELKRSRCRARQLRGAHRVPLLPHRRFR